MPVFHLEVIDSDALEQAGTGYGAWTCPCGFIVVAESEQAARKLADREADFGDWWLDDTYTSCAEIIDQTTPRVVMGNFPTG